MTDILQQDYINNAALLLHNVNNIHFSPSFAIYAVTANKELANDEKSIHAASLKRQTIDLNEFPSSDPKERTHLIMTKAKLLPRLKPTKGLPLCSLDDFRHSRFADAMRLAGYGDEETKGSTKQYRACQRYHEKRQNQTNPLSTPVQKPYQANPPPAIDVSSSNMSGISSLSPLSSSQCSSRSSTSSTTKTSRCSSDESTLATKPSDSSKSSRSDFLKLTEFEETRRTSAEAQAARAENIAWKDIHQTAYMVGSIILSQYREGRFPLKAFNTADKIATKLNICFGTKAIHGEEIHQCVKEGRTGQPPPKQGKPSRIKDDDFLLLCELVFTCQSIEQANCDPNRLNRPQMTSAVMRVVNDKLRRDGIEELMGIPFYNRVQKELSRSVKLSSPNYREALRAAWLTWENQKKHYENWELWLMELGFARLPHDEEERQTEGNVVFFPGQKRRIIQFDEMGFSFDGSKNGKGGRPAAFATNPDISEPHQTTSKSSQKITCMYGLNYEHEPLPPMFVFQSAAEEPKVRGRLVRYMKHVKGQFGYPEAIDADDIRSFPPAIAFGKEGSVDEKSLIYFIEHHLCQLYPDAQDVAGKRVLMKADSGPGRWSDEFRSISRSYGFYFYPGLPNGTELGQEMDQLFSFAKTLMEMNRDKLWRARSFQGTKAQTSSSDTPWIVFGGEILLENGTTVQLRNAFGEAFTPRRLERATTKCGYIPATRSLLKSPILLQQITEDNSASKNSEEEAPFVRMLNQLETRNHVVVAKLQSEGFLLADELKRSISRVKTFKKLSDEDATKPNTKDRQDRIINSKHHAGEWYTATHGGAPLNCDDAIIALERIRLANEKKILEKTKNKSKARQEVVKEAKAIMKSKGKEYNPEAKMNKKKTKYVPNWTIADLKIMIKYVSPTRSNIPTERNGLVKVWDEIKHLDPPASNKWTRKMEKKLQQFEEGGSYTIGRTYVMRQAERRKKEQLCLQISSLEKRSAVKVIGCCIQKLPEQERRDLLQCWPESSLDDDYSTSTVSIAQDIDSGSDSSDDDSVAEEDLSTDDSGAFDDGNSDLDDGSSSEDRKSDSDDGSSSSASSIGSLPEEVLDPPQQRPTRQRKPPLPPRQSPPLRRSNRQQTNGRKSDSDDGSSSSASSIGSLPEEVLDPPQQRPTRQRKPPLPPRQSPPLRRSNRQRKKKN